MTLRFRAAAALILLLSACAEDPPPESDPTEDRNRPGVWETSPGRYDVLVESYNWGFNPQEIRVRVGATVGFRVRSVEDFHGFSIAGTDVELALYPGATETATYTFLEAGEYRIECHIYCGSGHYTMESVVVVE